jgi:hypothetical protein
MTPHRFLSLAPFALTVLLAPSAIAQITPGRLCVMRAGDGTAPLTNASTPAFLDEYDRTTPAQPLPIGTLALPIAPVGLNLPVTISGTATSEGFLKQSVDGQYLLAAGYGIAPGTASVGTSTSAAVNRVVARISLTGAIDSSTALNDAHSGGSIRSAVSVDGTSFWTSGAGSSSAGLNPGMAYAASLGATTSTRIPATLTNGRVAGIFNNQLYLTTAAASTFGIVTMGAGLPTTSGQVSTLLPGFSVATGIGTISQYDFWFADAATVYVADDRTMANGGGIQKWIDIAGTWTWLYTLSPGTGCRGLTGISDQAGTTLYATTALASANGLVSVVDTGALSLFTTLATAPANTAFRGVQFVRTPSSVSFAGVGCTTSAGIPTVGTTGGAPVSGNANFGLTCGNAPAGAPYIAIVGINQVLFPGAPLAPLFPPCAVLYSAPDALVNGVADGAGNGIIPLGLTPPDTSFWGLPFTVQNAVYDPAFYPSYAPFYSFGFSDGMQVVVGN